MAGGGGVVLVVADPVGRGVAVVVADMAVVDFDAAQMLDAGFIWLGLGLHGVVVPARPLGFAFSAVWIAGVSY